jgi:cysteine desulfurase/selenocysteine lyase
MLNIEQIRNDFPILGNMVNNHQLVYFDNGASPQKPKCVIDAVSNIYLNEYSNVHRGLHYLSNNLTDKFEGTRNIFQKFINAKHEEEIIFTSGATESVNLIAYTWGKDNLKKGDEIILSIMEHHANIVPWHFFREKGVKIRWWFTNEKDELEIETLKKLITEKTKLIGITHMSNVFGTVNDIKSICKIAKDNNIKTVVDGSQSIVHMKVDVQELDCDFYVSTGHKLYGPSSSGFLYIRKEIQDSMPPFLGGGDMIDKVTMDDVTYNSSPHKFEAGTPGIVNQIGLGEAIKYINSIGMENITQYEEELKKYMNEQLQNLDFINVFGNSESKGCIFSFKFKDHNIHAHDVSTILDKKGVAIRVGHHCAQPLMEYLEVNATSRASLAFYNTKEEVDKFIESLKLSHDIFS